MILKNFKKYSFSLIELLIVIGILGALAALILPSFSDSEESAKETACTYNQAGLLRYLNMFHSSNGVYPAGFHTGAGNAAWDDDSGKNSVILSKIAAHNFTEASENLKLSEEKYADSLINAGIAILACGQNDDAEIINLAKNKEISVKAVSASDPDAPSWTGEIDPVTGEINPDGAPITYRGISLGYIAQIGEMEDLEKLDEKYRHFRKNSEPEFKVVPLFAAPSVDWETYYKDGPKSSKVSVAVTSKCPKAEKGQARYYIAFFKVYADGTPAKLLCCGCPDCGITESEAF